jgi:hypothetical protein
MPSLAQAPGGGNQMVHAEGTVIPGRDAAALHGDLAGLKAA